MKNVYVENESLSKYCAKVFGSIFKRALLEIYRYRDGSLDFSIENAKRFDFSDGKYDALTIVIEFSNGAAVRFENSEWASFRNAKPECLKILE